MTGTYNTLHSKTKEHNNLRKQKVPKVCLKIDARGSHGSKYVFMINDLILFDDPKMIL